MKLFFIIVSIALIMLVESARFKRANAYIEFVEATANFLKELIPVSETSVTSALENIPKTETYEKYRKELQSYLDELHTREDTAELCLKKSIMLVDKFYEFIVEYSSPDAPEEAKVVFKFLDKAEEEELRKEIDQWKIKFAEFVLEYGNKKDDEVKEMDTDDAGKIAETVSKVC